MKVSVARGELLDALTVVTKALSSRTTLPILAGVLLSAEGSDVVLQSTDLEISIKDRVSALVEGAGSVVVPGRLLAEVVRSLPEAKVDLETTSFDKITVTCAESHSSFSLKTLSADDFPKFPEVGDEKKVTIPAQTMLSMTKQVTRVVSRDESRPILTGVLLVMEGDTIRMVATDSYRLAIREEKLDNPVSEDIEVVIPGKALEEVPKLAADAGDITMGVAENQVVFEFGRTVYVTRRLEGTFPNYKPLIPKEGQTTLKVDRGEFTDAVKRVSLLAQHNAPLRIEVKPEENTLHLSAKTPDIGDAEESLMVEAEGQPVEIAFNHSFLVEGMSTADEETLEFVASGPLERGVFRSVGSTRFLYLIMPVRP
jgi:DNA polymerase-3 subunit beta